ncbi:hypothetical protein E1288_33040 [Saccharopolyspora elongata]|uniref:DDE Tnp4 domain-containing protein n=1 Tax=Saccharopolyspora elongata TaxID=2530387 RepID=A0A4V2YK43_9PSEU|nr:hypothetical protein E1288_33040 [Saccharopolyspora elongata]
MGEAFRAVESTALPTSRNTAPRGDRHRSTAFTGLIVDGTLVPTHDRSVSASSKNYRYSTNLQVVIDANTRLTVAVGKPLPGNRNGCRAYTESGVDQHCTGAHVMADSGYQGITGVVMPYRKPGDGSELPPWKEELNTVHKRVRARVEHALAHEVLEHPPQLPTQTRRRLARRTRRSPHAQPHHGPLNTTRHAASHAFPCTPTIFDHYGTGFRRYCRPIRTTRPAATSCHARSLACRRTTSMANNCHSPGQRPFAGHRKRHGEPPDHGDAGSNPTSAARTPAWKRELAPNNSTISAT